MAGTVEGRRGQRKVIVQPVKQTGVEDGFAVYAKDGPPVEIEETPALAEARRVIGGSTWAPAPPEGDPGPGFYRFRKADIPDLDHSAGARLGGVVELFAHDLAGAQAHLGLLVAKAKRKNPPEPVEIRPTHHRRTRLSKKHRKVIG